MSENTETLAGRLSDAWLRMRPNGLKCPLACFFYFPFFFAPLRDDREPWFSIWMECIRLPRNKTCQNDLEVFYSPPQQAGATPLALLLVCIYYQIRILNLNGVVPGYGRPNDRIHEILGEQSMQTAKLTRLGIGLVITLAVVIVGSAVSVTMWGGRGEQRPSRRPLTVSASMTVGQFAERNEVPAPVMLRVFGKDAVADAHRRVDEFFTDPHEAVTRTQKYRVIFAEEGAKNWRKIFSKFALWAVILAGMLVMLRTRRVSPGRRRVLYGAGVVIFGIALGADPSPMGTVKDAVVLYAREGVIFPPRMVALTVFLLTVLIANKFICSWGCQIGVLQDFIFRINRDPRDRQGLMRQWKPPFWLANSMRVAFFVVFTAVAVAWSYDVIGAVDPFKIFHPTVVSTVGWVFIAILAIASLFVYRPWCHFFCPFGLAGWVVEQVSIFKVKVDRDSCSACGACAKACPSMAMDAILKGNRVVPDCFSCATCFDVCPTNSISFGKSRMPPRIKESIE